MEFVKVSSNIPDPRIFFLVIKTPVLNCRTGLLQFFSSCDRLTIPECPAELVGEQFIKITGKAAELDHFKEYFTVCLSKMEEDHKVHYTKLLAPHKDRLIYGVYCPPTNGEVILIKLRDDGMLPPYSFWDRFMLVEGMIPNYHGDPVVTDIGKFVLNQFCFVDPLGGDMVPYLNKRFDPSEIDQIFADLILNKKIGRKEFNKYMGNAYLVGEDGSITVPCWSERSVGTDPKIAKRKEELFSQLKGEIDPDKLAAIEAELVQMDKDWVKGDISEAYWGAVGKKAFNEERKKNYISWGMTPEFGETMKYVFVEESLEQGWNQKSVQIAANDVRRGSYSRSMETAKGGAVTKQLMRVFQGIKLEGDDCGTKRGLHVLLTPSNYKEYVDRYLMNGDVTTLEFLKANIGKEIVIRSPMFCQTKGVNYCAKCCGRIAIDTNVDNIGLQVLTIGSQFLLLSMKQLHVGAIKIIPLKDFSRFLK